MNEKKKTCTTISSDCVTWQGPDIPCLGLCHGATVTEVVYELATKFCNLSEQFNVDQYDLQCLATQECPPKTFKDMIILLIEAICEIQNRACPECEDGLPGNYVVTEYEPIGANCQYGGVVITTYNGQTNLPIPGEVRYVCNGAPGEPGEPGQPGAPGEKGKKGDPGENATENPPITVSFQQDCTIEVEQLVGSPDYSFRVSQKDSGWKDLRGFNHYGGSVQKPQVRLIGKQLHFRGNVIIPLSSDSGATLIPLNAINDYDNQPYSQVYTGVGGVTVNTAGAITINKGVSVLPVDLDLCSLTIDGTYQKQYISSRQILVTGSPDEGASLSGVFQLNITSAGLMVIQTLLDIEQALGAGVSGKGGSPLRMITSNVKAGEYVPDYINTSSNIHKNPASGVADLEALFTTRTWPFDCDAGNPAQIGGFSIKLDGLIAYLS